MASSGSTNNFFVFSFYSTLAISSSWSSSREGISKLIWTAMSGLASLEQGNDTPIKVLREQSRTR